MQRADWSGKIMERASRKNRHNRLWNEQSPYLLQHAENPVDWYPWSSEAFEKAARENRPIFLSIGYSTCHWCHVMAHECFEDEQTAQALNEHFISIKVDREERPDIDSVYMTVCQMMTGSGGWPLSIIMTPDKKPFFAATYIPKETRAGRIGMLALLPLITRLWKEDQGRIQRITDEIENALKKASGIKGVGSGFDESLLQRTFESLSKSFDEENGGFSETPKFPTPSHLLFLMRYWKRTGEGRALEMVEKTLSSMRSGGIFDQIGFGFHRYSTDSIWLIPHFEKMLYDQGLLLFAYSEAYQITKNEDYRRTAQQVLSYVLRNLTSPEGGFYSAEDADSEGEEGKFYLWTMEDIEAALSPEESAVCRAVFGVEHEGNYLDELNREKNGKNILHLKASIHVCAEKLGLTEEELRAGVEAIRIKLFWARESRVRPQRDDKILTDWNGIMIAAAARAFQVFGEESFLVAAKRACEFILSKLRDGQMTLLHRYREGSSGIPAYLSDYAFLVWGILELYEATFEERYLLIANDLNEQQHALFWDGNGGGYFLTSSESEKVLVRTKELYDGAIPSGNAVALVNLLRLHALSGNQALRDRAERLMENFSEEVVKFSPGYTFFLSAVNFALGPVAQIVVAGEPGFGMEEMIRALRDVYIPNSVVLLKRSDLDHTTLEQVAPFTKGHSPEGKDAACFVCGNFSCSRPTTDVSQMLKTLHDMGV